MPNPSIMRNSCDSTGTRGPQSRGNVPPLSRRTSTLAAITVPLLLGPVLVVACAGGSADQVTTPVPLGMASTMAAFYDDGELALYQVQRPVPLPVRKPTSAESSALGPAPKGTPYPHAPFLRSSDESIEVHYTLSNLDQAQHTMSLLIDP